MTNPGMYGVAGSTVAAAEIIRIATRVPAAELRRMKTSLGSDMSTGPDATRAPPLLAMTPVRNPGPHAFACCRPRR